MTSSHDQYGPDLTRALDENTKLRAERTHAEERARGYADELSARADDHAFCDALRAFLTDDWRRQYQLAPLLAEALDIDPARTYLDIRKGEIHLVIRADGDGGERWDDYARAREARANAAHAHVTRVAPAFQLARELLEDQSAPAQARCDRCVPGADGRPIDVRPVVIATPCEHVQRGSYS